MIVYAAYSLIDQQLQKQIKMMHTSLAPMIWNRQRCVT